MMPKTTENRVFRVTEFWRYSDPLKIDPGAIVTGTRVFEVQAVFKTSKIEDPVSFKALAGALPPVSYPPETVTREYSREVMTGL